MADADRRGRGQPAPGQGRAERHRAAVAHAGQLRAGAGRAARGFHPLERPAARRASHFKARIFDIDDLDLRHKFIQDALRWGGGESDETLARTFQEYEKESRRLRRVLRQIQAFGEDFDADTLDAFLHLSAPPPKILEGAIIEGKLLVELERGCELTARRGS